MIKKYLLDFGIILFLFLLQQSFLSAFQFGIQYVQPIFLFIVFLAILIDIRRAYVAGMVAGILFDAYSALPDFSHVFSFLVAIYFMNMLFIQIFTNRSFYTICVLTFIGSLVFQIILYILDNVFAWLSAYEPLFISFSSFTQYLALTSIYNTIVMMGIYLIFTFGYLRLQSTRISIKS